MKLIFNKHFCSGTEMPNVNVLVIGRERNGKTSLIEMLSKKDLSRNYVETNIMNKSFDTDPTDKRSEIEQEYYYAEDKEAKRLITRYRFSLVIFVTMKGGRIVISDYQRYRYWKELLPKVPVIGFVSWCDYEGYKEYVTYLRTRLPFDAIVTGTCAPLRNHKLHHVSPDLAQMREDTTNKMLTKIKEILGENKDEKKEDATKRTLAKNEEETVFDFVEIEKQISLIYSKLESMDEKFTKKMNYIINVLGQKS